jgi:hypothetical protein
MIENPIWNVKPFAYPAAFTLGTLGTLGRNTIDGPHLVWSQASASKQIRVKEFATLELRYDINNIFKNLNPSSTVNLTSLGLFGKLTGTQGGWCCLGGQFVATFVAKLVF